MTVNAVDTTEKEHVEEEEEHVEDVEVEDGAPIANGR